MNLATTATRCAAPNGFAAEVEHCRAAVLAIRCVSVRMCFCYVTIDKRKRLFHAKWKMEPHSWAWVGCRRGECFHIWPISLLNLSLVYVSSLSLSALRSFIAGVRIAYAAQHFTFDSLPAILSIHCANRHDERAWMTCPTINPLSILWLPRTIRKPTFFFRLPNLFGSKFRIAGTKNTACYYVNRLKYRNAFDRIQPKKFLG